MLTQKSSEIYHTAKNTDTCLDRKTAFIVSLNLNLLVCGVFIFGDRPISAK